MAIKLYENDPIFIVIFTLRGEANEYCLQAKRATWVSDFYWIYVTLDQRSTGIYGTESRGRPRNPKFLKIFLMIPWFFSRDKTGSYSKPFVIFFFPLNRNNSWNKYPFHVYTNSTPSNFYGIAL